MTHPLNALADQIELDWEALTPPSEPNVKYHRVDGFSELTNTDRAFVFDLPIRGEPVAEDVAEATQVEWELPIRLRLEFNGRNQKVLTQDAILETSLLARSVERRNNWPTGVLEVLTLTFEPDARETEHDDAEYTLTLRALIKEID